MLSIIRRFLRERPEPRDAVVHPLLGEMRWSADSGSWLGHYGGFRFSLAYEGMESPSEAIIAYALDVMRDAAWLASTLADAKEQALRTFEPFYAEEIRSLSLGEIHFSTFRGTPRILADLEPGRDFRCWRVEYEGRRCEGIGFDT